MTAIIAGINYNCPLSDEVIPFVIKLGFSAIHGIEAAANDLGKIKDKFGWYN